MRQSTPPQSMLETRSYPTWIKGFEPRRTDMVFDRTMPSCYSSLEFARTIERTSRSFVLAGFSAEMSCLSTMIQAFHFGHQVIYLADASACGASLQLSAADMCKSINAILPLYGAVSRTQAWIRASTRIAATG
jgi:nicotinamidase-related amidase